MKTSTLMIGGALIISLASNLIQYAGRVQEPELRMDISRTYGANGDDNTGNSRVRGTAYCGDAWKSVVVNVDGGIFPADPQDSWDASLQGSLNGRFSLENVAWGTDSDGPFTRKGTYSVNAMHHRIAGDVGTAGHTLMDNTYVFIEPKK